MKAHNGHLNKKFLETDYPQGRAIEVFRRFHFGLGAKNRNFVFYLTRNCLKSSSDLSKGEVNRKPLGRAIGELLRLKNGQYQPI